MNNPIMNECLKTFGIKGVHPAAELFPLMVNKEFDALCESIGKDGLEEDIVLTHDGLLLDGRNRLRACYVTGQNERFRTLPESYDYIGFVVRMNIHRRHLKTGQKAAIALEVEKLYSVGAKGRQVRTAANREKIPVVEIIPQQDPKSRDQAARDLDVNPHYVSDAKKISKEDPEVFEELKAGTTSIPEAKRKIAAKKAQPKVSIVLKDWKHQIIDINTEYESKPKFNKTDTEEGIEWASWSWNPVTGCNHGCLYCYAREIGNRFTGHFLPTLHLDRLRSPFHTNPSSSRGGSTVFVCSMADLFGDWVPDEWVNAVLEVASQNTEWTFLFLTKNPERLSRHKFSTNCWVGATIDSQARVQATEKALAKTKGCCIKWLSLEPLLEPLKFSNPEIFDWVVIGGASRTSKTPEWTPPSSWVIETAAQFPKARLFIKSHARPIEWPGRILSLTPGIKSYVKKP